ncbi:S1 family peptidase [Nocardia crassostreae]|uniref:S1 family peptidase n=1 Tax=Nocardia crassostreae TaxID=53428 RepID=UPI000832FA88|nr:S1 family peptidase [Nocardia crassostreae]
MGCPTTVRRTILGACTMLAITVTAVPAAWPQPPRPALPGPLVAALERDLGLDAGRYLARAEAAQRLAQFERRAEREFTEVWAGARMDDKGRPIVALTAGTGEPEARRAALAAGFSTTQVLHSTQTLRARRAEVERWYAAQEPDIAGSLVASAIDVTRNTVAIYTSGRPMLPETLGPALVSAGSAAPIGPAVAGPARAGEIAARDPGREFHGGHEYGVEFSGRNALCSLGFHAAAADGSVVNISAGHCDPNNLARPEARTGASQPIFETADDERGAEMGRFVKAIMGPRDYSIIRINDRYRPGFENNLVSTETRGLPTAPPAAETAAYSVTAATLAEPLALDGVALPVVGAPVCKAGRTTGFTCGTIIEIDRTMYAGGLPGRPNDRIRLEGMFAASICTIGGDSGGAGITGTRALGIVSTGSNNYCTPENVSNFQPLHTVLSENPGLRVRVE